MPTIDEVIHDLDEMSIDLHFDVSDKVLDQYINNINSIIEKCKKILTNPN